MATKKKDESLLTDRVIAWFHLNEESCGISHATRDYLIRAAIGIERTFQQQNVKLTPVLELRVIDVLTQAMVSREMQGAITQDGVVIEEPAPEPKAKPSTDSAVVPEMPEPPKPRLRKLNPMVEHQAKCWDRLRKATDTFEKSFAAAQAAANQPGRWTEILKKTKGVMDDALAYEKKRLAKLKAQGKLPPPGPGAPIPPELVGKAGPFGPIPPAILKMDELEAKAAAGDLEAQKELDEMPWPPI